MKLKKTTLGTTALAEAELNLIQAFKYVGAQPFVRKQNNFELNTKFNC